MRGVALGSTTDDRQPSVEGIDWTVQEGDWWMVEGAPGTGKSRLLATAAGLHPPTAGRVRLFGAVPENLRDHELSRLRRRLVLVFEQGGRLLQDLTVEQNVALPVGYHDLASDVPSRVSELLEATQLSALARHRPSQISMAWRQRAALTRALALRPEVLLLDNPFLHLDHVHWRWWISFLQQLSAGHPVLSGRGLTLVMACAERRGWLPPEVLYAQLSDRAWNLLGPRGAAEESHHDAPARQTSESS
jgi:ABC-type sulfate/molybdate transport systems ATPase subunit